MVFASFHVMHRIDCSGVEQKVRFFLVEFIDKSDTEFYKPFSPYITLVAEASWNGNENQLNIIACQILNRSDPLGNAFIGDCSTRLSLRLPAVWSITNSASIVGQIWTTKNVNDIGYFSPINLHSIEVIDNKFHLTFSNIS